MRGLFRQSQCMVLLSALFVFGFYIMLILWNSTTVNSEIPYVVPVTIFAKNNTPCTGYGKSVVQTGYKCEKRFPNALIIGAEKGGTGALLRFITQHPQVVTKENEYDELRFFCKYYDKGYPWYKQQMPHSLPGQIVIEKSVDYLMKENTPKRVFEFNPKMKLILAVRNPVERVLSDYAMHKALFYDNNQTIDRVPEIRIGYPFPAFEEIWPKLLWVLYDVGLENWLKYYSLSQIHIVENEVLMNAPVPELKKIENFLNIDPYFDEKHFYFDSSKGFYCLTKPSRLKRMGKCLIGKGLKHPTVNQSVIQQLREFFLPHNRRFYQLTGKQFNWDD